MNLLISGLHGFVGSNLAAAFKNKYSVYGLDIVSPEKEGVLETFSWEALELQTRILQQRLSPPGILEDDSGKGYGKFPEPDVIIHLAGKAHDVKNRSAAQEYFDINTGLTRKIFDYFLLSRAKKFIFFSSVKAAADFVVGNELTEDVLPAPVGPYGESKIAAENYIREKFEAYRAGLLSRQISGPGENSGILTGPDWPDAPDGKQIYILRPCMIHGPGNKGNLNLLYKVVKKGLPWPLGDFENRRTFTSVDNLCFVIDGLISENISSGIYHMADDEALSTNELIRIMCGAMGKNPRIWNIRKDLMTGCAKIGSRAGLPLNMERLAKLTENYVVSNRKIKNALGIDKMPVTAREGLMKTIKSFR